MANLNRHSETSNLSSTRLNDTRSTLIRRQIRGAVVLVDHNDITKRVARIRTSIVARLRTVDRDGSRSSLTTKWGYMRDSTEVTCLHLIINIAFEFSY